MVLFIEYPKCSTCKKAKKWLIDNKVEFEDRDIIEKVPTEKELRRWITESKKDIKKFFNTSGIKYKQLNLKEKLKDISDDEKIKILSSDGMLIKRPLVIKNNIILTGFNQKEWEEILL